MRRKAEADKKRADAEAERAKERERDAADARKADAARKKTEADKKEAERKKQEQLDQAQRQQAQREARAEEQRLAKQREDNLKRMMGQAGPAGEGSPTSSGTAARDAAPSAGYAGRLVALIRRNSVFTGSVDGNPATEVEVRAGASGTIIARRIVKSSGSKPWDDAVLQAIDKTGTLPRDTDGRVPPLLIITFRPHE